VYKSNHALSPLLARSNQCVEILLVAVCCEEEIPAATMITAVQLELVAIYDVVMFVGARGLCPGLIRAAGSHGDRRAFIAVHGSPQNRATSGAACLAYRLEVSNYPFGSPCSPLRIGASSARFGAR
jgi:hypothetical protein